MENPSFTPATQECKSLGNRRYIMKIIEITIHNWRSIRDLTLSCGDLMILIGQNNHGKSNILSAILFFFGEIGVDVLDFHRDTEELFVEITFSDLDEMIGQDVQEVRGINAIIRVQKSATKDGHIFIPRLQGNTKRRLVT